jgi:hypothetical protein
LGNTKRLGRYHLSVNNNNNSGSPSYFEQLASFYKDIGWKSSLSDWNKPLFGRRRNSLEKVLAQANNTIERSQKLFNKIKSREVACSNRAKSIPENATIRKEYIKCSKPFCHRHKHGPYYYAYWKDPESKKLKKKYIGDHMPKKEE